MSGGTVLWYNTGEEEVTMNLALPRAVKCFDDEGHGKAVSETPETQLNRRRT